MSGLYFPTYKSIIVYPLIKQTPVSISLRYKGKKLAGYYRSLVGSSTNNMIYLAIEPVNNYAGIFYATTPTYDSANFLSFGAGSAIADDTLYKIDLVISGTTALLYYSGSLVGSITDAKVGTLASTYFLSTLGNNIAYSLFPSNTLAPGSGLAPGANIVGHCNGTIYDFTIYNYARSTFEDPTTSVFDINYGYDTTATAVIMNPDGAAVTPATTNLVYPDATVAYSAWGTFVGAASTKLAPRNSTAVSVIGTGGTSGGAKFYHLLKSDKTDLNIPVTADTTYTLSCSIQSSVSNISSNTMYVIQYDASGTIISEAGLYSATRRYTMANGFDRIWGSFTTASNCTYVRLYGFIYAKHQVMVYDFQLEQRAVATAFVPTTKAASVLSVPSSTLGTEGTISILWRVGEATSTYSVVFGCNWWTNPITRDTINFYRGTGWDAGDRLGWMIYDGSAATALIGGSILGINSRIGHLLFISLGWSTATTTGRVYVRDMTDGTILASSTNINTLFNGFSSLGPLYIGTREGSEPQNGIFRSLSIYNKMLTVEELKTLSSRSLGINELILSTSSYREVPAIPADAHYYPLASNTYDKNGIVSAYAATNVVYEDSAAWVGSATTNYWASTNPTEVGSGLVTAYGASGPNLLPRWLLTKTGIDTQSHGWKDVITASLASGSSFTISFYTRKETLGKSWSFTPYSTDLLTAYGTTATGEWNTGDQWKKTWGTSVFNRAVTSFAMNSGPDWPADAAAGTAEIAGLMWEAKPFPSPYVLGTRAAGKLQFNLNSSIGLNWSGDWSICYWKKPVGTRNDVLTDYNIDSLGCNSNSVGTGYTFWGKTSGANTVGRVTYDAVNISNFFNKWHFISIIKSGTTATWTWRLWDGQLITKTATLSGIAANYFVTQYGYDLQLGGWDNGNPCNSYFKDLIVLQRALTATELTNIYRQMRAKLDSVSTSMLVEEGI